MNGILKFVLLALPYFFMTLGFGIYDRIQPEAFGIPFFYWYQLAWVFIAAILTFTVYAIETGEKKKKKVVS
ncbi:DUF3311 domain-containing protein [Ferroplasma sp.]|uniref:DUF3311 domain-containing protein n=1 Tax=Ferroplasma sp. TaxID=2591003 RepID=UPI00307EA50A